MKICIVKDCDSTEPPFFCLPPNYSDRIKWMKFSGRNFKNRFPEHALFCIKHFREESMVTVNEKLKLLKHAAPILNAPRNVDISGISNEVAKNRNRGNQKKIASTNIHKHQLGSGDNTISIIAPTSTSSKLPAISFEKILDLFKKQAASPWGWLETDEKFYFYKCDLPPIIADEEEISNCVPLMPMTTECLIINKNIGGMSLTRRGENIDLHLVAPLDFDIEKQTVIPKLANVNNFIQRLKSRNDPTPNLTETLQFHANSIETLGRNCLKNPKESPDEKLGSALIFISNQLGNWVTKCSEYNKLPQFVPSIIRMALLVRAQSKAAYATLRDCDQLFFPNQNILAPFGSTLTKAPQGLTSERSRFLTSLSKSLEPSDRIISLIIDETLLTPKMNFDSNGMIIGHAVNDVTDDLTQDVLANKMVCYVAQGISKDFSKVVTMYPVMNPSIDFLKKTLLQALHWLDQAEFKVQIVIANNTMTYRKIYRLLSKKNDEGLENDPIMKHPCDPDNSQLILSYDPIGLIQSLRNDMFRREEFPLEFAKDNEDPGSISWVLLASLKDHEEEIVNESRQAVILQTPNVSQLLKSNRIEKPDIKAISQLLSENVQNALKYYSDKDADMWPKNDIQATCDFMQNTSTFLKFMSESLITNFKTIEIIEETAKYFKNVAVPSGVLVKSTGQGLVQSCRAMALLLKILSNTMGISNLETTRLRKNESWLLEVEHSLLKDKISKKRIPDDVLPPKIPSHNNMNIIEDLTPKKRGRKRKIIPEMDQQVIVMPGSDGNGIKISGVGSDPANISSIPVSSSEDHSNTELYIYSVPSMRMTKTVAVATTESNQ